jgi:plastocyanin
MQRLPALPLLLCALAAFTGCKEKPPPPVARTGLPGQMGTATIQGTVRLRGEPPPLPRTSRTSFAGCGGGTPRTSAAQVSPQGALAEVFVWIRSGLPDGDYPIPHDEVLIDQRGCEYIPRVAGVRAGQTVAFRNGDETLHNVHALGRASNAFNFGMPLTGMQVRRSLTEPQVMVTVACDVHPWMRAFLGVVPHPFFAVTGPDGSYALKGLPPGTYSVEVWQEALGRQQQTVTVGSGDARSLDFTFGQ